MKLKNAVIGGIAALCLAAVPALGQNPHAGGPGAAAGAGAGGSHGVAMGNGMGNGMGRTNANIPDHGPSMKASNHASASSPTTLLERNTKLDSTLTSKLQSKGLLPSGTDLKDACSGFRNLGQCVAAIHVSHNLNLSFDCLKADMTGTAVPQGTTCPADTGSKKLSLGKSIQQLSPSPTTKSEAKTAEKQAKDDINEAKKSS